MDIDISGETFTIAEDAAAKRFTVAHAGTDATTGEATEVRRRPNLQPFLDDPDCWLVSSVEEYDEESGTARMGPVFTERVIHPPAEPVVVTAADALAVTCKELKSPQMVHHQLRREGR